MMIFKKLENTNELIKSITCGKARLNESEKVMGGKPFVPSLSHSSSLLSFFNDNRSKRMVHQNSIIAFVKQ